MIKIYHTDRYDQQVVHHFRDMEQFFRYMEDRYPDEFDREDFSSDNMFLTNDDEESWGIYEEEVVDHLNDP